MQHIRLAVLVLLLFSNTANGQTTTWGGWTDVGGDRDWIQINVESWETAGVTVDLFGPGLYRQSVEHAAREKDRVEFTVQAPVGDVRFEGTVAGRSLTGELHLDGKPLGHFDVVRFAEEDLSEANKFLGSYRTSNGKRFVVVRRAQGGLRLITKSGGSWTFDAFLPWRSGAYFASATDQPCLPPKEWIEFQEINGRDDFHQLSIHSPEGTIEAISSNEIRVEEIEIENGEIRLPGMIMFPPGDGPFPLVVWNHGSGPVTADAPWDMFQSIRMVEELGAAVLNYDKRGSGRANGDESTASHSDLADDILAIVRFAKDDERFVEGLIGVGGTSQAPSWPIPIAASKSADIRFIIALSGQAGPVYEADVFNLMNRLQRAGFDEVQIEEARVFILQHTEFIKTPERQQEYDQFVDAHREKPWFELVDAFALLSTPLADPALEQYRQNLSLGSSIDYWKKVSVPTFVGLGADDHLVDVATTSERLRQLITHHGRTNLDLHVYPSPAGHAVGTSNTPTYFQDLKEWFQKDVRAPYRAQQHAK